MSPPSVSISKIGPESEGVLQTLMELYLHDMAEWFEVAAYDVPAIWANGCDVYLAKADDSLAGFAIVGSVESAHDVREFFVARSFRRSGVGKAMATLLWNERPGEWLVRVLEANAGAVVFWRTAITKYSGGSYAEEVRSVKGRPWRFFRFTARQAI